MDASARRGGASGLEHSTPLGCNGSRGVKASCGGLLLCTHVGTTVPAMCWHAFDRSPWLADPLVALRAPRGPLRVCSTVHCAVQQAPIPPSVFTTATAACMCAPCIHWHEHHVWQAWVLTHGPLT